MRKHLSSGSLVKSALSVSCKGRMAVGEGDKVTLFDVGVFIGQPTPVPLVVDKSSVKALSRNAVRFEVLTLEFNPANEAVLAVAGVEECQVQVRLSQLMVVHVRCRMTRQRL